MDDREAEEVRRVQALEWRVAALQALKDEREGRIVEGLERLNNQIAPSLARIAAIGEELAALGRIRLADLPDPEERPE